MAEIHIEKKRRSIWPWILGVLVVIGLVWLVVELSDKEKPKMAERRTTGQQAEQQTEGEPMTQQTSMKNVNSFVSFIEEKEVSDQMGVDPQVTGDALGRLSAAMKDLAGDDQSYQQQINSIEQTAQEIKEDPESLKQADKVSQAFQSASTVLSQIQADKFPEAEQAVNQVEDAAKALNPQEQLQTQQDEVKTFFEESADAMEEMSNQASS